DSSLFAVPESGNRVWQLLLEWRLPELHCRDSSRCQFAGSAGNWLLDQGCPRIANHETSAGSQHRTPILIMREEAIRTTKIRQLNLPPPLLVQSGSRTEDVIAQMRKGKTTCALICKGDRCIGIFTERDFLDKILDKKGDSSLP